MNTEKFEMVAKTFQGLEEILADELRGIGALNVQPGRRMVAFEGDLATLYKANLCCRTALRILKPIYKFTASDPDALYEMTKEFDWTSVLSIDKTFSIDSVVNSEQFTHSRYVTYRVKDGIVDFFKDRFGADKRPGVRLQDADVMINVHIDGNRVTLSLDSSGESLHKRGYRVAQTEAPINEVLAAGILLKSGWKGECPLVDPMCGSGTFLIEAALIAANINPGVYRKRFAFEQWKDFDEELFESLYNDDSQERTFDYKIYGSDISPKAIAIAEQNIKQAGVGRYIDLSIKPLSQWTEAPADGVLVTNPPYGERISVNDMDGLYEMIGNKLKNVFKGYHAWILGYRDEHFREIGLKASLSFPVLNGALECQMREYVLFEGSYADFKSAGGSVSNTDFNREVKPKVHRASDEEWIRETRKFGSSRPDRMAEKRRESERREFKKDRREFQDKKHGGKPGRDFKGSKGRDFKSGKPEHEDKPKYKDAVSFKAKHPGISREKETRFAPDGHTMRSRKGWKKQNED